MTRAPSGSKGKFPAKKSSFSDSARPRSGFGRPPRARDESSRPSRDRNEDSAAPRRFRSKQRTDDSSESRRPSRFGEERPARGAKLGFRPRDSFKAKEEFSSDFKPKRPRFDRDARPERSDRSDAPRGGARGAFGRRDDRSSFGHDRAERSEGRPARGDRRSPPRFDRSAAPRTERAGTDADRPKISAYKKERSFTRDKAKRGVKPLREAKPAAPILKTFAPRQGVLIWGLHAVREALLNDQRTCFKIWTTESGRTAIEKPLADARAKKLDRPAPEMMERQDLEQLLPSGSVHQGVVMEVAPLPDIQLFEMLQQSPLPDLVVVLDQVTDPHNIGAILRSAAAFGAGALIMTERNSPSTTGVMAKTACGAAEYVPQIQVVNLSRALTELQQAGYWCVGLAEEATRDIGALDLSSKTAIVLGAEGDGMRRLTREHCDELARLPTGGPIGSLNVSNAAAVALYEIRRQKTKFEA